MQNDKLLPCPFCGGEAQFGTSRHTWIECTECSFETEYTEDEEKLVRMWNTRKPMERIVEQLEEEKQSNVSSYEFYREAENEKMQSTYAGKVSAFKDAIDIVRKGGVDNAG